MSSTAPQPKYPHQTVFGLPFFNGNISQAVDFIWQKILDNELVTVATPNPEQVVLANEQIQFRHALQEFNLYLPDGQGILWAAKKFHQPLQERIAGVDVVKYLVEKIESAKLVGLVVGGRGYDEVTGDRFQVPGRDAINRVRTNKAASIYKQKDNKKLGLRAEALGINRENLGEMDNRQRVIELSLVSSHRTQNPEPRTSLFWFRNYEVYSDHDNKLMFDWIEKNRPVVVFVALGAPLQELWIEKHKKELKRAGVRCIMAVGGSFDVLTGKVQRAPEMVQAARLEWLWRLIQQPWRWRRQLRLVRFVGMVMTKRN